METLHWNASCTEADKCEYVMCMCLFCLCIRCEVGSFHQMSLSCMKSTWYCQWMWFEFHWGRLKNLIFWFEWNVDTQGRCVCMYFSAYIRFNFTIPLFCEDNLHGIRIVNVGLLFCCYYLFFLLSLSLVIFVFYSIVFTRNVERQTQWQTHTHIDDSGFMSLFSLEKRWKRTGETRMIALAFSTREFDEKMNELYVACIQSIQ